MVAKTKKKEKKNKKKAKATIPFSKENYLIFLIGVLVVIIGYIFMSQGPADSFWSLTLAPIILVISYCIIIPISILYKKKSGEQAEATQKVEDVSKN